MTLLRFTCLLATSLAVAGCSELPRADSARVGPHFQPTNVRATATRLPPDFRRVVVLPVAGEREHSEETLTKLDDVMRNELNRLGRFEVVSISREQLAQWCGVRQLNSTDALPAGFAEKILAQPNTFGADGVLFIDLTAYSPYPPLSAGLRTKLARVRDREILWAADHVFTAANPAVANAARKFALELGSDRGPGDLSHTVLQNPSRFASYAAAATFGTLPPR
jgi:hypothetical protein